MSAKTYTPEKLKEIANRLTPVAIKQRSVSIKFRQPKLERIMKGEELYFNTVKRTLKGRFNIPLPIVSGFVDTNLSKIDDEITINFDAGHDADKIKCRKCNAAIKNDAAPTRGMWRIKDILTKKLAIFAGVGINKIYSESDPVYKNHLFIVDSFDFHCEATGGWNLNDHMFRGVDNLYRSKSQVQKRGESGLYDAEQVTKLITWVATEEQKKQAEQLYNNRQNRHKALNLDIDSNAFTGVPEYNFTEWEMYDDVEDDWFYILFEPMAGVWARIAPLIEIVGEPDEGEPIKSMFKAWHTHPDAWNFWSKAPIDDVIPIAVAMKALVNFMFDEVQKRLWGQRIFDPEIITDPSQLEWDRPDKLIMATVPNGKKISDGVYEFPTGDKSTVTINMLDYFRNFVAVESGVTPQAKGESDEKLLGIAKINEGEVADRLGLTNIFYTQFYAELGDAWLKGARMCRLGDKTLIQMIGEDGTESVDLTGEDFIFASDPSIRITGGKTEARKSQEMQEAKANSLETAVTLFPDKINAKLAIEHLLRNGKWDQSEITPLLDVSTDGDEEESVFASQAIEDILNKKKPELYQGATTRFMQKIVDFAKKRQTDPKIAVTLIAYAVKHQQIVIQNMAREQMLRNMNPANNPTGPNAPQDNSVSGGPSAPKGPVEAPVGPGAQGPTDQPSSVVATAK